MSLSRLLLPSILVCASVLQCATASAAVPDHYTSLKGLSYLWTIFTNPTESFSRFIARKTTAAEEQHVLPQMFEDSSSDSMVVYWVRSNHTVSDRVGTRDFLVDPDSSLLRRNFLVSLLTLGNDTSQRNLDAAYRMGAYGRTYSVLFHSYQEDSSTLVCALLDGPSMLLYGVSWLVNIPQKFVNQVAYYTRPDSEVGWTPILDIVLAPLVLVLEGCFALLFTVVGFVLGCLLNPINSLASVGGMFWYLIPTLWTAVAGLVIGIMAIVTNVFTFIGLIKTVLVLVLCGVIWTGAATSATE